MDRLSDLPKATRLGCSVQSVLCALAVGFGILSNSLIPGRWKFCLVGGNWHLGALDFVSWAGARLTLLFPVIFPNYHHTETCFGRKVLANLVPCCFQSIGKAPTSGGSSGPKMSGLWHHSAIHRFCIHAFHSH